MVTNSHLTRARFFSTKALLCKVRPVGEESGVDPLVLDGEWAGRKDVRVEHQEDLVSVANA